MDLITAIVLTSPIPSHPSIAILVETVNSIRHHLPEAPIIVAFDGVRDEQKGMRQNYLGYIRNVADDPNLFKANTKMIPFMDHKHQVGMMRNILPHIETPLILFCEHDTPLVTDYPIQMENIAGAVNSKEVNSVRFLHEAHILPEHAYLMHGQMECRGVTLTKTTQFSARPHVASVEFYKKLLGRFSVDAKCFVEDYAHSVCQTDPWDEWKLSIYTPSENNIKRSYHTDGRNGGAKYDDKQIF